MAPDAALPEGLLDGLTAEPGGVRAAEVERGRRCADERTFDDGVVVQGIAEQLLLLST